MLAVLEQAQGAGQKTQQDAEIGQGSIFDLFEAPAGGAANGAAAAFAGPTHPPIPDEEFEQNELLALEKEAIGLFLSTHPLKEVREALLRQGRPAAARAAARSRTASGSPSAASSPRRASSARARATR